MDKFMQSSQGGRIADVGMIELDEASIEVLMAHGFVRIPGTKYFQMPEDMNLYNLPESVNSALNYLVMWRGYGYGVAGFIPPGLEYS